ncbi:hypothetical protein F2Q70_00042922 [Brassica cretica]|uniref:Uncharacterized protein n=1 Tax=Brassica cretica TaxID=69181 RepID=A0A8S9KBB6_BRACR|nr:hypothetical protein F2Q70_00042922 [Brassica cretica]
MRLKECPVIIREKDIEVPKRNQQEHLPTPRNHKGNSVEHMDKSMEPIPQTEASLADKDKTTGNMSMEQDEDDISMEEGEFNKMVDYYNDLRMAEEMIEEDDLLEDIVVPETQVSETQAGAEDEEYEQIEAIARLRKKATSRDNGTEQGQSKKPQKQSTIPSKENNVQRTQKGLLKVHKRPEVQRVIPRSPDPKGIAASRKLAVRGRLSPKSKGKKKAGLSASGRQASKQVPHSGVFPSALKGRKPVSTSGLVSQKPPSTNI